MQDATLRHGMVGGEARRIPGRACASRIIRQIGHRTALHSMASASPALVCEELPQINLSKLFPWFHTTNSHPQVPGFPSWMRRLH